MKRNVPPVVSPTGEPSCGRVDRPGRRRSGAALNVDDRNAVLLGGSVRARSTRVALVALSPLGPLWLQLRAVSFFLQVSPPSVSMTRRLPFSWRNSRRSRRPRPESPSWRRRPRRRALRRRSARAAASGGQMHASCVSLPLFPHGYTAPPSTNRADSRRPSLHVKCGGSTRPRDGVKVFLLGRTGKVGTVLTPALEHAGHELVESATGADAAVDFTRPDAVVDNVRACLEAGVPCVDHVGLRSGACRRARPRARAGGVLRAELRPRSGADDALRGRGGHGDMPAAAIVELRHETKLDAPSGTAKATAALLPDGTPIRCVQLPASSPTRR